MIDVSAWRARLSRAAALAAALALALAIPSTAQEAAGEAFPGDLGAGLAPGAPSADESFFSAGEWAAFVDGKTLTYHTPSGLMGREYYPGGSNRVIFIYRDGRCYDGTWSEEDGVFCFAYDGIHCFRHFSRDGRVMVRELDGDEQVVTNITVDPLSCDEDLVS